MRGITIEHSGILFQKNLSVPTPQAGEALIRIQAAALNRRDHWISIGKYPAIQKHSILGSDGCGVVEKVLNDSLEEEAHPLLGKEVVLCPSLNWGQNQSYQSKQFSILGMPQNGCFAEYTALPIRYLEEKPKHLTAKQAAALPLAGLTAWRALFTKALLQPKEKILITGVGGGVSLIALQLALAVGAEAYVSSSSDQKIEQAVQMGAKDGFNYNNPAWYKGAAKHLNVVLDSAGGPDFDKLVRLLGMGGRLVFIGGTKGKWSPILPQHLFFNPW